jgi:NAD(P)-dependent dehydrogenase (short-subunit alcohol dehydrogenase family)
MIPMDVTDDRSVADGVDRVVRAEGRLDALVNNAGYGIAGAVEETSIREAQQQFDTNFFGMFRLTKAVLPRMRERRSGLIVNMGSIGGLISIPFQSFYCATKFAIEGFTEALRMEVRGFGVRVALIEPGDHQTNFTRSRIRTQESQKEGSAYRPAFEKALGVMERDEQNGPSPDGIARRVAAILSDRSPALRHPVDRHLRPPPAQRGNYGAGNASDMPRCAKETAIAALFRLATEVRPKAEGSPVRRQHDGTGPPRENLGARPGEQLVAQARAPDLWQNIESHANRS